MVQAVGDYLREQELMNDQRFQGTLEIYTTASAEEYREKAAKVGLFPVTAVREYSSTAV